MKNTYIPVLWGCTLLLMLLLSNCQKPELDVVGNWQFKTFNGQYVIYTAGTKDSETINYHYDAQAQIIIETITHSQTPSAVSTFNYGFKYSNWNIQNNGAYTINENADSLTTSTKGTWEFLYSNANFFYNAVIFENGGSRLFEFMPNTGLSVTMYIPNVTNNELELAYSLSTRDSMGSYTRYNAWAEYNK